MAGKKTEALVLRSLDFGESDRIVHLLVREAGRVAAIAKGARRSVRRFPGTLDLFNHLRVQLERSRPGSMWRLDQASLIQSFAPLRRSPRRFAMGCYLLELLDRLAPEVGSRADSEQLFRFAVEALECVSRESVDRRLRILLELRALDALGLRPELRRCVRCGREASAPGSRRGAGLESWVAFHVAEGGPICASCAPDPSGTLRVEPGTLRALEQALRLEPRHLDRLVMAPASLEQARRLLDRFQRFHLGVELRSQRFLEQLESGDAGTIPAG